MLATISIENEMKKFQDYFNKAKEDPALWQKMASDPISVLETMDIPVKDPFKGAVVNQMRTIAKYTLLQERLGEADIRPVTALPNDVSDALEFSVQPWGLVLTVREPAIKYLQGGGSISASTLGAIAALAGIAFPGIGLAMGLVAAALGIFLPIVTMTDQGKGVYLTWTWVQFSPFLVPPFIPNPMYGIPVVTPVT